MKGRYSRLSSIDSFLLYSSSTVQNLSSPEDIPVLKSEKSFREDEDLEQIPWMRISKDTMEATGPLIVIEKPNEEVGELINQIFYFLFS